MSLRDQLLRAGVVDKKTVQRVNREEKEERKQKAGAREARAVVEAREAAAREAERLAHLEAQRAAHLARERARAEKEQRRLVSNLLRAYRVRERPGGQLFFFRSADGRQALRLQLAESMALDLRAGRLAVAWAGDRPEEAEHLLLQREAALRVAEVAPERLVFFNQDPPDKADLSEKLYDMGAIFEARARVPDRWAGLR